MEKCGRKKGWKECIGEKKEEIGNGRNVEERRKAKGS